MSKQAGIAVVREVWAAEYEPLFVRASQPGYVQLSAESEEGSKFWGNVRIDLPSEMARALGKALLACADESEAA